MCFPFAPRLLLHLPLLSSPLGKSGLYEKAQFRPQRRARKNGQVLGWFSLPRPLNHSPVLWGTNGWSAQVELSPGPSLFSLHPQRLPWHRFDSSSYQFWQIVGLDNFRSLILASAHRACICAKKHPRVRGRWFQTALGISLCQDVHGTTLMAAMGWAGG